MKACLYVPALVEGTADKTTHDYFVKDCLFYLINSYNSEVSVSFPISKIRIIRLILNEFLRIPSW